MKNRNNKINYHEKLGEASSTAICGNDILSSALYVSGIAILFAGIYAPLILLLICFVLYLYKKVYTETVEALPVNGGVYNCLLNGTSKTLAAIAGVMTLLSYLATAVISAKVSVEYLNIGVKHASAFFGIPFELHILWVTICVLLFFAVLVIMGVKDTAKVAVGIFAIHVITLSLFIILGGIHAVQSDTSHLAKNMAETGGIMTRNGGLLTALFFAFSASLLGVSGFESSANFVEEQKKGVFRLTLGNMLIAVTIFNPLIALVVLHSMSIDDITNARNFLLADVAYQIGGVPFQYLLIIDAFLVLCGAVLTAYVGVSGLTERMSADSCLPGWLSEQNNRGSYPRIVIIFFFLCSSILLLTGGDLLSLAGVYSITFLAVMSLFALGNMILRQMRPDLKRTYRAPLLGVIVAFLATVFGLFGNIEMDPNNLLFFLYYFVPALLLVLAFIYQGKMINLALRSTTHFPRIHQYLKSHFRYLTEGHFVAFIHHVSRMQSILDYISKNEAGHLITLVHCRNENGGRDLKNYKEIEEAIPHLKKAGFYPHLEIHLIYIDLPFGPETVTKVAEKLNVPKNRVLIGSIHTSHKFDYADLGGVRIIFG